MSSPTILLTAVGSASAACAVDTFHQMGLRVAACDLYPKGWTAASLLADSFTQTPPASEGEGFVQALMALVKEENARWLIPLIDPEVDLLCSRREDFAALGCTLCLPEESSARLYRDKRAMAELLKEKHIGPVIPTFDPYDPEAGGVWVKLSARREAAVQPLGYKSQAATRSPIW